MLPPSDISATIYTALTGGSSVTDLVGTRIYPVWVDQTPARPYITYNAISGVPMNTLDDDPLVDMKRIQIDVWADSYSDVRAVESAVRGALQSYGRFVSVNEFEESELRLYRVSMDLSIFGQK